MLSKSAYNAALMTRSALKLRSASVQAVRTLKDNNLLKWHDVPQHLSGKSAFESLIYANTARPLQTSISSSAEVLLNESWTDRRVFYVMASFCSVFHCPLPSFFAVGRSFFPRAPIASAVPHFGLVLGAKRLCAWQRLNWVVGEG